ncbi:hypothetical protein ACRAWG_03210 [Methylobacterium sp. P31]
MVRSVPAGGPVAPPRPQDRHQPLPVHLLQAVRRAIVVRVGEIKPDGPTMIAVLVMGGFTRAEIGKRIPVLPVTGTRVAMKWIGA